MALFTGEKRGTTAAHTRRQHHSLGIGRSAWREEEKREYHLGPLHLALLCSDTAYLVVMAQPDDMKATTGKCAVMTHSGKEIEREDILYLFRLVNKMCNGLSASSWPIQKRLISISLLLPFLLLLLLLPCQTKQVINEIDQKTLIIPSEPSFPSTSEQGASPPYRGETQRTCPK